MDKELKAKIEAFIETRMENLSVELKGEHIELNIEADESQEKLETTLSKEQKKLFIEYDLKNNLRCSAENELYYRLGFYEGIEFLKEILREMGNYNERKYVDIHSKDNR